MSINKRHWHHAWRILRKLHPWYFVGLTLIFGVIALVSLRHNNEQMIQLRSAVYTADKNNGDVEGTLRTLRAYVYTHMNTSLATGPNAVHPPIQLKYTYERLQAAQAEKLGQTNTSLYNDAQHYCEQQDAVDFSGRNRVPCIESYVESHGVTVAAIPDGLYKFDFTSAKWSPDLAGLSIVAAALTAVAAALATVYRYWAKRNL